MILPFRLTDEVFAPIFSDVIHSIHDEIDGIGEGCDSLCLSGSTCLSIHGYITRKISDIDICVLRSSWKEIIKKIERNSNGLYRPDTIYTNSSIFRVELETNFPANLCLFQHENLPDNLSRVNMHGRTVNLYPPVDIIRYKIVSIGMLTTMSESDQEKHLNDIQSFVDRAPKNVKRQIESMLTAMQRTLERRKKKIETVQLTMS